MRLILASSSLQRKKLLNSVGYKVDLALAADIDEKSTKKEMPAKLAARLAIEKCSKIAIKFPDDIVIAASTIVAKGKRYISKPIKRQHVREVLRILSGSRCKIFTGVCIKNMGKAIGKIVMTKLKFKKLSEKEITVLLDSQEWQNKAVWASCLGIASTYITCIHGSYTNIMGLPIVETYKMLQKLGAKRILIKI
jgi:septum formation protein